jgi:carbon storage regulator
MLPRSPGRFPRKEASRMLILSRKVGEQIQIGPDIVVTVVRVTPTAIRLGVAAPTGVTVIRSEIRPAPLQGTVSEQAPSEQTASQQTWQGGEPTEWT